MIKISGIYSITNTVNGKIYIGSSIDISARMYAHKWLQQSGTQSAYTEWVRSWRQTIECRFNHPPVLTAHLQKVRCYEDGRVEFEPMGEVIISMDQLQDVDLSDAVDIQSKLTRLIGDRIPQ